MKPNIEQQNTLKKYLRKNLKYSETYAEFYDHILTALENISDISFEDAVNQIIHNDFGGSDGMIAIENRYRKQTIKEMQGRYLRHLADYLRFPLVFFLIIGSIMIYYLVTRPGFGFIQFFWSVMALALIPSVLNGIRYIRAGYVGGNTKRSVKDAGFTWLKHLPGMLFALIVLSHVLYSNDTSTIWLQHASPIVITLILTVYMVHSLAFYSVFRHEYKLNLF